MLSDQKDVVQRPIKFYRTGEPPFDTIREYQVPEPPMECEGQQVLDWAVVTSVMTMGMDISGKMRVVAVYAERWHIPTEDVDKPLRES